MQALWMLIGLLSVTIFTAIFSLYLFDKEGTGELWGLFLVVAFGIQAGIFLYTEVCFPRPSETAASKRNTNMISISQQIEKKRL